MKAHHSLQLIASVIGLLIFSMTCVTANAEEQTPQEQFDAFIGEQYKKAMESRDDQDNIELGKTMVSYMDFQDLSEDLKLHIAQKIVELIPIQEKEGWPTLQIATDFMIEKSESHRPGALMIQADIFRLSLRQASRTEREDIYANYFNRLIEAGKAYEKIMDLDNAVDAYRQASSITRFISRQAANVSREHMQRARLLKTHLDDIEKTKLSFVDDPTPARAAEIARLYIVSFDNLKEALPYISVSEDPDLIAIAKLHGLMAEDIALPDAMQAGMAYGKLAEDADQVLLINPLARAVQWLSFFVERNETRDMAHLKAQQTLLKYTEQLEKLGGESKGVASRKLDVLKQMLTNWQAFSSKHMTSKTAQLWTPEKGSIQVIWHVRARDVGPMLHLPLKVKDSYELELEFLPQSTGFYIVLPREDSHFFIYYKIPESGGPKRRDEKRKKNNLLIEGPAFNKDQPHKLKIQVKQNKKNMQIIATVNNEPKLKWSGDPSTFAEVNSDAGQVSQIGIVPLSRSQKLTFKAIRASGAVEIAEPQYSK